MNTIKYRGYRHQIKSLKKSKILLNTNNNNQNYERAFSAKKWLEGGICLESQSCYKCSAWSDIKNLSIKENLLSQTFFDKKIKLSVRFNRAICFFIKRFGQVISKEELLIHVWGEGASPSNVTVLIYELRLLLIEEGLEIITVRGSDGGYLMKRI